MDGGYKMKVKQSILFLLIASLLMLSACGGKQPMLPNEMHSAPNFKKLMPETITAVTLKLNQNLDVSDTAFYPDRGIQPSTSWPYYLLPDGETEMKNAKELLAVRVDPLMSANTLVVCFPESLTGLENNHGVLADHAIKRLYNSKGQMIYAPDWQDRKVSDFSGFIEQVGDMNVIEAHRGEKAYDDILTIFVPFVHEKEKAWSLAINARDSYYLDHDIPVASALTEQQMKMVTGDEKLKTKLISFLKDDWYGVITFPLWTPEQYGMSVLITKVFKIPTHFWSYDFDRPGYMDRKLTAIQGGAMINHYDKNYGFKSMFSPEDVAVLQELIEQVKEKK
jgi:hypothetical protein